MKLLVKLLLIFICFGSCQEKTETEANEGFDIFLIAGQSNTLNGMGILPNIDSISSGICQLGRHGVTDYKVLEAIDPLEHWDKRIGKIGFGLTFAKLYQETFLKSDRKVLLIPCGKGSSGFISNEWNKGNNLYDDAVTRINWVTANFPGSELKAVLWHQGEHDVNNQNYLMQLDQMIIDLRSDIKSWESPKIFIAGGLVPFWVSQDSVRFKQQYIISSLVDRIPNSGFADPSLPNIISKPDDNFDQIHFDANGQRELGRRYFSEYCRLRK